MIAERTPFQVFTTTSDTGIEEFHFNLLGPIEEPSMYVELFQVLRNASDTNRVHVYLNTPGGRVDTMIQIINCMKNTEAVVVTHLEALCHSAGTYIFLSGDEFVVNPNSLLLFHNYTGGTFGKGNEIVAEVLASDVWVKQINDDIYYPFLTREEIDSINAGVDKWMYSDEVVQRLETVVAEREEIVREQTVLNRRSMKEQIDALVEQDEAEAADREEAIQQLAEKKKSLKLKHAELQLLEAQKLVNELME